MQSIGSLSTDAAVVDLSRSDVQSLSTDAAVVDAPLKMILPRPRVNKRLGAENNGCRRYRTRQKGQAANIVKSEGCH
eukprot:scaffold642_cov141-Skeletonema_marinoi.AAC.6